MLDGILEQHDYPPVVEALVAEMAVLTALIGQTIKLRWKLSLQVQSNGPVRMIATDYFGPKAEGETAQGQVPLPVEFEGRIGIAAQAVGIAQGAFEEALAYSKEREQFGKSISNFQAIQHYLADMSTEIDAGRLLTWKAAWAKTSKKRYSRSLE